MNKLVLFFVLLLLSQTSKSEIVYEINKYHVMIVTFVSKTDSLTTDLFELDWKKAIQIASTNKKVKQIQLKDNSGGIIGWADKKNISSLNNILDKIIQDFPTFDKRQIIYGDSVKTTTIIPAQYHSDVYKNGRLESEYSSDYTQGFFAPKTSTYKSGSDTYTTRTYYTPVKYIHKWTRPVVENKIIEKGETVRLRQIYKIIM